MTGHKCKWQQLTSLSLTISASVPGYFLVQLYFNAINASLLFCRTWRGSSSPTLWSWTEVRASLWLLPWRIQHQKWRPACSNSSYVSVCIIVLVFFQYAPLVTKIDIMFLSWQLLFTSSDVEDGGETVFPSVTVNSSSSPFYNELSECAKKGLSVKPKMGDALLFWSMRPDGSLDPTSLHGWLLIFIQWHVF